MARKRRKPKMTRQQMERELLRLFNVNDDVIPRTAMTLLAYDYAWHLWSQTARGKRELANR